MPEKSVEASRNYWFHTGDSGFIDEDGYLFFLDRVKDRIRRRGENISSFEVEQAILTLPCVKEVAAFAVPSGLEGGEDEIMISAVLCDPAAIPIESFASQVNDTLPRFARPRYIHLVDDLPKTKTHKLRKGVLRDQGLTRDTWDCVHSNYVEVC